jgi:hypothetical protein
MKYGVDAAWMWNVSLGNGVLVGGLSDPTRMAAGGARKCALCEVCAVCFAAASLRITLENIIIFHIIDHHRQLFMLTQLLAAHSINR